MDKVGKRGKLRGDTRYGSQMTKREWFDRWFKEFVREEPGARIKTSRLYESYGDFLMDRTSEGREVEMFNPSGFGMALTYRGFRAHKNNDHSVRRGIALNG